MSSMHKVLVIFALCVSAAGCVVDGSSEAASDEEDVGEVGSAWSLDAPQRGWVDVIYPTVWFGPIPGWWGPLYRIQGWACLKPNATASSLALTVYQGGPPGVGSPVSVIYASTASRPDVLSAGACTNLDSGFDVVVSSNPNLPAVFYVSYHALSPAVTLEGTNG